MCVPESILEAEESIVPMTCHSVGGTEGVCLSTCLPEVAQTAALLPQDICLIGEACVPCISPLDGQETGACGEIMCSEVPVEAADEIDDQNIDGAESEDSNSIDELNEDESNAPSCCAGEGTCLAPEFIPKDQNSSLKNCRREGHRELMCVPNDFLDLTWVPQACTGGGLLGGEYEGVCLSDCLKFPFEFTLDRRPCAEGYVCAPCVRPLSGEPSGAPGCEGH